MIRHCLQTQLINHSHYSHLQPGVIGNAEPAAPTPPPPLQSSRDPSALHRQLWVYGTRTQECTTQLICVVSRRPSRDILKHHHLCQASPALTYYASFAFWTNDTRWLKWRVLQTWLQFYNGPFNHGVGRFFCSLWSVNATESAHKHLLCAR